ncbi:MAG: tRNA (guanosine(37)-N1)-methyltransferase TrmD [Candidatus Omnitrophica bacterium]|nr:tRNA (guanosine(37)-N1)-methyltransferase TrmD [Candidatus Omnitrophota bacterium]
MRIDLLTIFPEMFPAVLGASILQRAQDKGLVQIAVHDLRDYTHDKRRTVDDRPFGGGPGMVMKAEPIFEAVDAIEAYRHPAAGGRRDRSGCQVILTAPQGERLTQALARELAGLSHLLLVCGHYEGVDERIRSRLVDRDLSIGDYVLTGGELPAMVMVDAVVRLIPGVLGHEESTREESFSGGLLEYPQYTRPVVFQGMAVPEVLRSGNHEEIATWRKLQALARTAKHRPDLLQQET